MWTRSTLWHLLPTLACAAVMATAGGVSAGTGFVPLSQDRCVRNDYEGETYGEFCEPFCDSWAGDCRRCADGFGPFDAGIGHQRCFLDGGFAWQRSRIEDRSITVASRVVASSWGLMGCENLDSGTSTFSTVFETAEPRSVVLLAEVATESSSIQDWPQARVALVDDETGTVLASVSIEGTDQAGIDTTFDLAPGRYRMEVEVLAPLVVFAELSGVAEVSAVLRICAEDVDRSGAVGFADLLRLLGAWGPCNECPEDVDNSGVVDFADVLLVLAAWGPCRADVDWPGSCCEGGDCADGLESTCDPADFVRGATCTTIVCTESPTDVTLTVEPWVGGGWVENGFVGLTAYRVYAHIDEMEELAAVFGDAGDALRVISSDGSFHNDPLFDSLTAPLDLTSVGIWSNQWDTYVTIGKDDAANDQTSVSPGFAEATNDLTMSFELDNHGWFVTPQVTDQGDGPRVLIGQFVVAEGETISGVINVLVEKGFARDGIPFEVGLTTPCE